MRRVEEQNADRCVLYEESSHDTSIIYGYVDRHGVVMTTQYELLVVPTGSPATQAWSSTLVSG